MKEFTPKELRFIYDTLQATVANRETLYEEVMPTVRSIQQKIAKKLSLKIVDHNV